MLPFGSLPIGAVCLILCTSVVALDPDVQYAPAVQEPVEALLLQHGEAPGNIAGCASFLAHELASNRTSELDPGTSCQGILTSLSEVDRAGFACEVGRLLFGEDSEGWVGTNSSNYLERARVNWSGTSHLYPKCIVSPSNPHEVALVMKIVTLSRSRFSIRSGGHNPNRGWSNTDSRGLLIDLHRFTKVELSRDKQTVRVGPGNRWLRVYQALNGTGVTVLGGRTPDVGVGGVIIGGGIPSFSSEYGLACDRVQSFEVVLADSSIVQASPVENADLFWALKGGGPNFGIVTEYTLETIPVDKVWFEAVLYEPSHNKKVLEAISTYQKAAEDDDAASFAFSLSNNHTFVAWLYSKPEVRPKIYEDFYDIPVQRQFAESQIANAADFTASLERVLGPPVVMRRAIVGVSSRPNLELYKKAHDKWVDVSSEFFLATGAGMTFGIQPVTKNAVRHGKRNNGSPLHLSEEPQTWFTAVAQWTDPAHDAAAHAAVQAVGDFYRETARDMGILLDFVFMNDANFDQNPIASYGEASVKRLKKIAKMYDPDEVFQKLQADGFLLRKV